MSTATALPSVRNAVMAALKALPILSGSKAFLEGEVKPGASFPYAVLGTGTETREGASYITQAGHAETLQVKVWGRNATEAMAAWSAVAGALHGVTLTLVDHLMVRGGLDLITNFSEPGATPTEIPPHVVVGRLRTQTLAAA